MSRLDKIQHESKKRLSQDIQKYELEKEYLEKEWERITATRRTLELDEAAIEKESDSFSQDMLRDMKQDLMNLHQDLDIRTRTYRDRQDANQKLRISMEKYTPHQETMIKVSVEETVSVEGMVLEMGLVLGVIFVLLFVMYPFILHLF